MAHERSSCAGGTERSVVRGRAMKDLLRTASIALAILASGCAAIPTGNPAEDFLAGAEANDAVEPLPAGAPPPKIGPPGGADMSHIEREREGVVIVLEPQPIGAVRRATSDARHPHETGLAPGVPRGSDEGPLSARAVRDRS